jgi:GT2 family glycosyltransferase
VRGSSGPWEDALVARVDVVVVTYNSRETVRDCVTPLCLEKEISLIIVDNASQDGTVETLSDLPLTTIARDVNDGFGAGCNVGWRVGSAANVVFLNPDSRADPHSVLALADRLESDGRIGLVGPRLVDERGQTQYSQRRFPSFSISLAAAFFVPRVWPTTRWSLDIADTASYQVAHSPDWVSGACVAIRRDVLEETGGFDEQFFMYHEDIDLCKRVSDRGFDVRYEPSISVMHMGGASRPRAQLIPVKARSRILYARKYGGRRGEFLERLAVGVHALTHLVLTTQGLEARRGYVRSIRLCADRQLALPESPQSSGSRTAA